MKTEKFTGTMKSAFGVKLTKLKMKDGSPCTIKKLNYDGEYKQYETKEEMIQAEGMPKDEDIVDWRNTLIKNAARAKAANAAVDAAGIQKRDMSNDDQLQLRTVFKALMAGGKKTEAEARQIASASVGAEWDDEEEDE
jgi:hypothetical protein